MALLSTLTVALTMDTAQFSSGLNKAKGEMDQAGGSASKLGGALVSVKNLAGALGLTISAMQIVQVFRDAVIEANKFEVEFQNVVTLFAGANAPIDDLRAGVLDLAGEFGSATDLARGLYNTISAGVSAVDAIDFLKTSATFAAAGLTDVDKATKLLASTLNAYSLSADQAEDVSDTLFTTIRLGITTADELASSMGRVVPTAAALGVSFQDLNVVVAALTAGGVQTSEAVSALKQVFANIQNPTKQAAETAEKLGINFNLAGLEARGLKDWLLDLATQTQGNTQAQVDLFGSVEAFNAIATLTSNQGIANLNKGFEEMKVRGGAATDTLATQAQTLSFQWTAMQNNAQAAFTQLWTNISPSVTGMVSGFNTVIGLLTGIENEANKVSDTVTQKLTPAQIEHAEKMRILEEKIRMQKVAQEAARIEAEKMAVVQEELNKKLESAKTAYQNMATPLNNAAASWDLMVQAGGDQNAVLINILPKLDSLASKQEAAGIAASASAAKWLALKDALWANVAAVDDLNTKLPSLTTGIEDVGTVSTNAGAPVVTLEDELKALGIGTEETTKKLDDMKKKLPEVEPPLSSVGKAIKENLSKQMSTAVTDMAGAMAGILFESGSFKDKMLGIFKELGEGIVRLLIESLLLSAIMPLLQPALDALAKVFSDWGEKIKGIFSFSAGGGGGVVGTVLGTVFKGAVCGAIDQGKGCVEGAEGQGFLGSIGGFVSSIIGKFTGGGGGGLGLASSLASAFDSAICGGIDTAQNCLDTKGEQFKNDAASWRDSVVANVSFPNGGAGAPGGGGVGGAAPGGALPPAEWVRVTFEGIDAVVNGQGKATADNVGQTFGNMADSIDAAGAQVGNSGVVGAVEKIVQGLNVATAVGAGLGVGGGVIAGATFNATTGTAATGSLGAMNLGFALTPWTAGIAALGTAAIWLHGVFTNTPLEAAVKEVARDLGGLKTSEAAIQSFIDKVGISEAAFTDIRKNILVSPTFLTTVAANSAFAQGKLADLVLALSNVTIAMEDGTKKTFDMSAAFTHWLQTGDAQQLNDIFLQMHGNATELTAAFPAWKDQLLLSADASAAAKAEYDKTVQSIIDWMNRNNELHASNKLLEQTMATTGQGASAMEDHIKKLKEEIVRLSGMVDDARASGGLLDDEFAKMGFSVLDLEGQIDALKDTIAFLEDEISKTSTSTAVLKGEVISIEPPTRAAESATSSLTIAYNSAASAASAANQSFQTLGNAYSQVTVATQQANTATQQYLTTTQQLQNLTIATPTLPSTSGTGVVEATQNPTPTPAPGNVTPIPGTGGAIGVPLGSPYWSTPIAQIPQAILNLVGYTGTFQHGGVVPRTGPAFLHEGEVVIPKDKVSRSSSGQAVVMGGGGGGISVTVNINAIDAENMEEAMSNRVIPTLVERLRSNINNARDRVNEALAGGNPI